MAIPKRTKDVSGIEDKVLSMYAKGMSQLGRISKSNRCLDKELETY